MPDKLWLTVTVAPNGQYELFNDMREQLTYNLRSEEADLALGESVRGTITGMSFYKSAGRSEARDDAESGRRED